MAKNGRPVFEECNIQEFDKRARKYNRINKSKDKFEETDLPSPPPDPWTTPRCSQPINNLSVEPSQEEDDIIAYLTGIRTPPPCDSRNSDCLSRNSATSTMAVASLYTEESFEQLDRLYEMAEQILEFRDRSSKLFRRVRELEKLKVLRMADLRAERAIFSNYDISSDLPDEDAGFAESLLDAIISSSRDSQLPRRNPRSPSSSRQRSRSLAVSEQSLPRSPNLGNRSALGIEKATFRNETSGVPKVSKWTRVKAAFKWERACPNDMTDSNVEQTPTPNTPTTKYLRIPDIASGNWSGTGELSGPSTPLGRPSSASSSNEDVFDRQRKYMSETGDRRVSRIKEFSKKNESTVCNELLEDDVIVTNNEDGVQHASEIRETNQGKPVIRITKENTPEPQIKISNPKLLSSSGKDAEVTLKKPTPTLTITIPSSEEEFRNVSSPESTSPLPSSTLDSGQSSPYQGKVRQSGQNLTDFKRQRSTAEESPASKIQRIDSKWNKVRRAFLSNTAFSVPPSPVRIIARQSFLHDEPETPRTRSCSGSVEDLSKSSLMSNTQLETRRDYQVLREKLSVEFHRKLIEWERLKRSTGANTRSTRDAFTSSNGTTPNSPHESLLLTEERLAPEFKKKLQEWKRSKKGRRGSTSTESQRVSRRRLTDWQLWRYPSKPETKVQEVMGPRCSCGSVGSTGSVGSDSKPHLCEDFVRRMEAWRRLSEASKRPSSSARLGFTSGIVDETEFLALNRVLSVFGSLEQETQQDSDWFEQRSNFTEKSQNLKAGNEILIQTSVGSYRFEGISQEFTRKLYDWEKFRGISPRSSTFRLLGPAYAPLAGTMNDSTTTDVATATDEEETFLGGIKRSKSVGSIMETSGCKQRFIRRSASLHSLKYLTEKLKELNLMNDSSVPDQERRPDTSEDGIIDDFEPEAMIVDIEDVIEETASPLRRIQPHQTPVYSVAASETTSIAVPLGTVTSSHEPSPAILMEVEEDSDREQQWESRSWNLRTDLSARDSTVPGNWHSFWDERTNFSTYDKSNSEFGKDEHRRSDHSYQHASDQQLWTIVGWNKKSKYFNENDESVKTDLRFGLTQNEQSLDDNKEEYNCINLKSDVASIHFGENNEDNTDKIWTMTDESIEATTVHSVSKSENTLTKTLETMEKSMELPFENNMEEQRNERKELKNYEDENDDEDINDGKKEIPIRNKNDPSPSFSYHHPTGTIHTASNVGIFSTNSTVLSSNSKTDFFRNNNAGINEISNKEKNFKEEYNADRKIFQLRQYGDDFNAIKYSHDLSPSSIIDNKYGNNSKEIRNVNISKEDEITRDNVSHVKGIETNRKMEQKQYDSFERISILPFKNDTMEYREPTIRTTPLTVSSQREARCVERIIINEETLKKIVVPTASNDSASNSSRSKREDSSDASNNHSDLDEACKDNNGLPPKLGSYVVNQNVNNNGEHTKQKVESTSRNVFVKTKRIIFSPFRRLDDRRSSHDKNVSNESNSNQMERQKSKSKSKSRSASPKTSRHETIPRIPLSLQWNVLRSSSKEPETKDDDNVPLEKHGEERSWFQKYHRRTRSGEERVIQKNKIITEKEEEEGEKINNDMVESKKISENINKKMAYLDEKEVAIEKKDEERKKVYRDPVDDGYEEIIVRETQQDHHLSAVPIFGIKEEDETERSTITEDKLPSDLVHKLRILSNAAAKRDGRIGSCIDTMTTESRSSKLQRAKEGFLSRRGGPLCQSTLEPMTSVTQNQKGDSPFTNYHKDDLTLNVDNINRDDTNWDTAIDCPIQTSSVSRSPTLSQNSNSKPELVKSASAGMINVDPDTFDRLATNNNRGCESLPRTISRRDSDGPLARIVNKLRFSKLIRGKDNESGSMSTISTLCRQSLLIDVRPDLEECYENEDRSDVNEKEENNKERR
ncbi:PREDICTED: uncharacterized protein LOC107065561 isoform X2 [Polistes dominula]|uniref:Uncharacterized protein LOC107065561 isoform X2 n=1 Tax=Polistes dominula TaxID=743375 RepID=A0ABM1I3U5_POLDO|nr:PREDICTED: uncharacterized protein LOC107065561 isoform X2 [Polistes dominula]